MWVPFPAPFSSSFARISQFLSSPFISVCETPFPPCLRLPRNGARTPCRLRRPGNSPWGWKVLQVSCWEELWAVLPYTLPFTSSLPGVGREALHGEKAANLVGGN